MRESDLERNFRQVSGRFRNGTKSRTIRREAVHNMQINQQIGCVLALSASTGVAVRRALILAGVSAESGGMRITARPTRNGYDYQFSVEPTARDTDLVVQQHGVRVYVDPFTAQHLDGSTIDFSDGDEDGAAFVVTLPKRFGSQPRLVA